jgi:hypothetical protein
MKRLVQVSAFYRNDEPDGVGVSLFEDFDDPYLDEVFNGIKSNYDKMWRVAVFESDTRKLIDELKGQLESIGSANKEVSVAKAAIVIGNVYMLEKLGELVPDEYNGLWLAYME